MPDVIYEMSRKKLGVTAVVDGREAGGDHQRRRFAAAAGEARERCDGPDGRRGDDARSEDDFGRDEFAATALALMEEKKITSLMVVDGGGKLEGIVHLHDSVGNGDGVDD